MAETGAGADGLVALTAGAAGLAAGLSTGAAEGAGLLAGAGLLGGGAFLGAFAGSGTVAGAAGKLPGFACAAAQAGLKQRSSHSG